MRKIFLLPLVVLLAACGTSQQPLYHWGKYPDTVYQGMQGKKSPDQQVAELEQYLEQAKSEDKAVAPGVYAQLGMLYVEMGRGELAAKAFNEEKARFPESAQFMDFLLKNKSANRGAAK